MLLLVSAPVLAEGRQLFLNAYVDDSSGKVLVVGNVDDVSGLKFLDGSESIHEDNGQMYAVCDSLIKRDGDCWALSFPADGYYDEYHAVFFVPGGFSFHEINCTEGLEILSTAYNGSIILDVQGFDLTDPAVNFRYG